MSYINHRPNKYPQACNHMGHSHGESGDRVKAPCCVDKTGVDDYGISEVKPECYCTAHCPVCGGSRG